MKPKSVESPQKGTYQKPGLVVIDLSVEEVLGNGCKATAMATGDTGQTPPVCQNCQVTYSS